MRRDVLFSTFIFFRLSLYHSDNYKGQIIKNSTLQNIFPEYVIREINWKLTKTSSLVIHFNNTDASLIRETEPFLILIVETLCDIILPTPLWKPTVCKLDLVRSQEREFCFTYLFSLQLRESLLLFMRPRNGAKSNRAQLIDRDELTVTRIISSKYSYEWYNFISDNLIGSWSW